MCVVCIVFQGTPATKIGYNIRIMCDVRLDAILITLNMQIAVRQRGEWGSRRKIVSENRANVVAKSPLIEAAIFKTATAAPIARAINFGRNEEFLVLQRACERTSRNMWTASVRPSVSHIGIFRFCYRTEIFPNENTIDKTQTFLTFERIFSRPQCQAKEKFFFR